MVDVTTGQRRVGREARGGLDVKVVARDRFTVDLTANPDFSQVKSDDPQVTINQRYEVYFPDKRPFFLESAGTFQTPEPLFFSRRIVAPRWGARVTGKAGQWVVGSVVARDRQGDGEPSRDALLGVVRLQREVVGLKRILIAGAGDFAHQLARPLPARRRVLTTVPGVISRGQACESL